MRKTITGVLSVLTLTLIVVLLIGTTALAAGLQDWFLTRTVAGMHAQDGTLHGVDNIMSKIEPTAQWPGMRYIGAIGKAELTA